MQVGARGKTGRGPIGRRTLGAAALGLASAGLRRARAQQAQQAPELRLGAVFPLSGPLALLGDESYRGVEMAAEERNASGGLLGRQIKLVRADAPDEATAVAETRRLATGNDRVAAIFGGFTSSISMPGSQVAEAAGVPWFELGAVADAMVDRGFRWVFRASPSATDYATVALEGVTEVLAPLLGVPADRLKLAIAHDEGPGAQSIGVAQESLARVRGLNLLERASYASRSADLGALVQRLRGQEAEVVLHSGSPGDEVTLFRAFRDTGWRPRMVIGAGGGYSLVDTARSLGDALLGAMSAGPTPFAVNERYAPGARAFADAYLRRYGAEPRSGHGLAAYVGSRFFLEAVQRAGGTEKEKVRPAVLALDVAEGTTATGWGARFDERGQNTRARPVLCQWQAAPAGAPPGLRQVVIHPAQAAVAPPLPRLGA